MIIISAVVDIVVVIAKTNKTNKIYNWLILNIRYNWLKKL